MNMNVVATRARTFLIIYEKIRDMYFMGEPLDARVRAFVAMA